jgi:hypothetical protein
MVLQPVKEKSLSIQIEFFLPSFIINDLPQIPDHAACLPVNELLFCVPISAQIHTNSLAPTRNGSANIQHSIF